MTRPALTIVTLCWLVTTGWAVAAEPPPQAQAGNDEVVHYTVNLNELPGAQVYEQTGARTSDGGCSFTDRGSGLASGHGRVLVITEVSFDPRTCVRELARAEYAPEALPAAVAAKVEPPASPDMTQEDAQQALTPGGPSLEGAEAPAVVVYLGSLKVNVEDPPQRDVTTTKSSLTWSNTGSRLNRSHHHAHWGWFTPTGWQRTRAHWSHGNDGSRAYTDTYGKYRNGRFCATIDTWTEHLKTYFEGRPSGAWSWSYTVHKWGGCSGLLHYEYILQTP